MSRIATTVLSRLSFVTCCAIFALSGCAGPVTPEAPRIERIATPHHLTRIPPEPVPPDSDDPAVRESDVMRYCNGLYRWGHAMAVQLDEIRSLERDLDLSD